MPHVCLTCGRHARRMRHMRNVRYEQEALRERLDEELAHYRRVAGHEKKLESIALDDARRALREKGERLEVAEAQLAQAVEQVN